MANTRTVGAAGDHTTVASAISWMQSNHTLGTDGIGKIEIIDAAEFNENVSISGVSGTASITSYIELTAASGVRHAGVAGTGHARIRGDSNGSHVITVSENYTHVHHLEIQQDSTGSSDEGIRVTSGITDVLISYCIIWTEQDVSSQDGVYGGNWGMGVAVDNCIIYGFNRAGLHAQLYNSSNTQDWYSDHNTVYGCGTGLRADPEQPAATVNFTVYNTASLDNTTDYATDTHGGTMNWSGTNNAATDGSLTTIGLTTGAQENLTTSDTSQSSGSYFVVNDLTAGSEDLTLLDDEAGNLATSNGTDRQGSEPDSRQDFSVSIEGTSRPTSVVDIGASQVSIAAGAATHKNPLGMPLYGPMGGPI